MKRILAISLAVMLLITAMPVVSLAATQYGTVTGGWLRLRSAASFDASTINSYYTGTQVTILGTSGSWYNVKTPDGYTGYMYANYITLGGSGGGVTPPSTGNYVTSANGKGVRLRVGPGTGYRVIGTYSVGTAVTMLKQGSYWSYIQIGSAVGYMMNQFIANAGGGGGGTTGDHATIWSANGYGVRLRSGPGTGYGIVGVYSVGTSVTVLQKGATWDYISVGSRVGYMMNNFLRYYSGNAVTAVTLNNTTPIVGGTLKVDTLTPANATVSYEWYVGGKLASTASEYTVTSSDFGYTIKLIVTGTGSFTGSATSAATSAVKDGTPVTAVELNSYEPVVGDVLTAQLTPAEATVIYKWIVDGDKVGTSSTYTVKASDVGKEIYLVVQGAGGYTEGASTPKTSPVVKTGTLNSVTIEDLDNLIGGHDQPNVGDVLTATLSPKTATATYKWYITGSDGSKKLLSETDTCIVPEIPNVKYEYTISVYCVGTGNYTSGKAGSDVGDHTGAIVKKKRLGSISLSTYKPTYIEGLDGSASITATVMGNSLDVSSICDFRWTIGGVVDTASTGSVYTLKASDVGKFITVDAVAKSNSSYTGTLTANTTTAVRKKPAAVYILKDDGSLATNIAVGDTLTASFTMNKSDASEAYASYTWMANGTPIGTGVSYTVKSAAAGKAITVEAVCKSDYTGTVTSSATNAVTTGTVLASIVCSNASAIAVGDTLTAKFSVDDAATGAKYAWTLEGSSTVLATTASIPVSKDYIGKKLIVTVTPAAGYTCASNVVTTDSAAVGKDFALKYSESSKVEGYINISILPTTATATFTWERIDALGNVTSLGTKSNITQDTYTIASADENCTIKVTVVGTNGTDFAGTTKTYSSAKIAAKNATAVQVDGGTENLQDVQNAIDSTTEPIVTDGTTTTDPTVTDGTTTTDPTVTDGTTTTDPTVTDGTTTTDPTVTDGTTTTDPTVTDGTTTTDPTVTDGTTTTDPTVTDGTTTTDPTVTDGTTTTDPTVTDGTTIDPSTQAAAPVAESVEPMTVEIYRDTDTIAVGTKLTAKVLNGTAVQYVWTRDEDTVNPLMVPDLSNPNLYKVTEADVGHSIRVTVTAQDGSTAYCKVKVKAVETAAPVVEAPVVEAPVENTDPVQPSTDTTPALDSDYQPGGEEDLTYYDLQVSGN